MTDSATNARQVARQAHWIEWLTGGISALLVAGLMGFIAYHAVTMNKGEPALSIDVIDPVHDDNSVAFVIRNTGKRTASAVVVEGNMRDGGQVLETHDMTFDYVPAMSSASGAIVFQEETSGRQISIHATAYADP